MKIDPATLATVTGKPATQPNAQPNALDFKQFAAMRRNADANDPAALREVARQFESIFTKMMLESMRSASFGDPLFGGDQTEMYQGMMDDQMAVQLSSGRGIGLADMLIHQLSRGGQDAASAAPAGSAEPGGLPITDTQRRKFVEDMLPHARDAAQKLGVDERSVIAQAALETGWGTARPADGSGDSHNYFGIKAGGSWRGERVSSDTTEFEQGVAATERAQFRAYGSVAENVSDYVRLLSTRYTAALNTGSDTHAFASALQRGGYATDPRYADKLVSVAAQIDRLDVNSFKPGGVSPIKGARTDEGNG